MKRAKNEHEVSFDLDSSDEEEEVLDGLTTEDIIRKFVPIIPKIQSKLRKMTTAVSKQNNAIETLNLRVHELEAERETLRSEIRNIESLKIEVENLQALRAEVEKLATLRTDFDKMSSAKTDIESTEKLRTEVQSMQSLHLEVQNLQVLQTEVESLHRDANKNNMFLSGIQEEKEETVPQLLKKTIDLFYEKLNIRPRIARIFRTGRPGGNFPRLVKIIFGDAMEKQKIWRQRKQLGHPHYLSEDLHKTERKRNGILRRFAKDRQSDGKNIVIKFKSNQVFIDDDMYVLSGDNMVLQEKPPVPMDHQ